MTSSGWLQIFLFFLILLALTKPMGAFMARLFEGERTWIHPVVRPVERLVYRLSAVDETAEQHWTHYAGSLLAFTLAGILLTYLIQRIQGWLPFNPQGFGGKLITPDLAFNTAVSFGTNTNWQAYTPETTVSYFTQMVGLAVHNFTSAAAGIATAMALVRGFARRSAQTIGNFWVDVTRATLYVLIPLSIMIALVFVWQGVIQNLSPYTNVATLEGAAQTIAQGPVASQEAIKMLGTNGGGFFNANSAHPFENPTPFSNFLQLLCIFVIPAGLTYSFGKMVRDTRQGWALFAVMSIVFFAGVLVAYPAEQSGNPNLTELGLQQQATNMQPGGNMEGKEVRFGIPASALFAVVTTDASCGAVNSMHDSFTPLGGMVPLVNIQLGEVIFGGVGAGLYGMLMYAILAVFLAGLMVGRTPEYLGKKIEAREIKLVVLGLLITPLAALFSTALATASSAGRASISAAATGPQGFSETFYAYLSQANNNGSAFAGYTGFIQPNAGNVGSHGVTFADLLGGFTMIFARYAPILFALAVAGSLAGKRVSPAGLGTMRTDNPTFVVLLIGVIVLVGALTFFPALLLGPIVQGLTGHLY